MEATMVNANNSTDVRAGDRDRVSIPPTGLLCPSCERPMAFTEVTHSYRCHACNPIPENVPECATQKCKLPLTRLGEPWNCWICLKCNKHPEEVNKMKKEEDERKRPLLDVRLTPETVSEMIKKEMVGVKDMIRDALAKPAYPPTPDEIAKMTETIATGSGETVIKVGDRGDKVVTELSKAKPETYLQKAKRLGVATHVPTGGMRKKADIVIDIAAVEKAEARADAAIEKVLSNEKVDSEETIAEAKAFSENAQTPPGEEDEFARGLTQEDMM